MRADGPESCAPAAPAEGAAASRPDDAMCIFKRYSAGAPLENFSAAYRATEASCSGINKSSSYSGGRCGVFHRDAEEALSSLLWQPYECREASGDTGGGGHSVAALRRPDTCARAMRLAAQLAAPARHKLLQPSASASASASAAGEVMGSRARTEQVPPQQQPPAATPQVATHHHQLHQLQLQLQPSEQQQLQQQHPAALLPPPYSTLPHHHAHHALPLPLLQPHAYPFQPVSLRRCQYGEDSERPKTCCGGVGTRALSLRWFIAVVALAGVCCVLVGTVLGAVRAHGKAHLTMLLLMIGVGMVLVTVSGVAWRAAGRRNNNVAGSSGGRTGSATPRRTTIPCARAHHPYAAMLYPEFHCRPPPPTYQASMHEYRLRLLLLDRATSPPPVTCPPPAYRPRRIVNAGPQYVGGRGARGRRRQEQITPSSPLSAVVIQNIALESYDDIKYDDVPEIESHIVNDCKENVQQEKEEGNLVTIVHTGEDTSPVIVTVSGSIPEPSMPLQNHTSEIDILAHL